MEEGGRRKIRELWKKKKITGEFLYSFSGERFLVVIQGFLAVTQNPDIIEDR